MSLVKIGYDTPDRQQFIDFEELYLEEDKVYEYMDYLDETDSYDSEHSRVELLYTDIAFGYSYVFPENLTANELEVYYYYKPLSTPFWQYFGAVYYPITFLVYLLDDNNMVTDILNSHVQCIDMNGMSEGWVNQKVNLKRQILKDEKVYVCVIQHYLSPFYVLNKNINKAAAFSPASLEIDKYPRNNISRIESYFNGTFKKSDYYSEITEDYAIAFYFTYQDSTQNAKDYVCSVNTECILDTDLQRSSEYKLCISKNVITSGCMKSTAAMIKKMIEELNETDSCIRKNSFHRHYFSDLSSTDKEISTCSYIRRNKDCRKMICFLYKESLYARKEKSIMKSDSVICQRKTFIRVGKSMIAATGSFLVSRGLKLVISIIEKIHTNVLGRNVFFPITVELDCPI